MSPEDYAKLPRTAVRAKMPPSDETATYEGVLVYELLQRAGVRFQDPSTPETLERKLPGALRTSYVLVEAVDGYQVVFSLAEVHPELGGRSVLLADRKNGQPLAADTAPYQVIVKDGLLQDRWIRQVTRILIQRAVGLEQEIAAANRSPDSSASAELVVRNESRNAVPRRVPFSLGGRK